MYAIVLIVLQGDPNPLSPRELTPAAKKALMDALPSLEIDHQLPGVENKLHNWEEFFHLLLLSSFLLWAVIWDIVSGTVIWGSVL